MTSANRRVMTVGWMTVMAFVWAIFVPHQLSSAAFAIVAMAGFLVTLCAVALLSGYRPAARQASARSSTRGPVGLPSDDGGR